MKYEYKTIKIAKGVIYKFKNDSTVNADKVAELGQALNEFGQEGWELIEMIQPQGFLGLGDEGLCIFKRLVKRED